MCFGGGQPAAPINKPAYAPDESDQFFDITMEDREAGTTSTIRKRPDEKPTTATNGRK